MRPKRAAIVQTAEHGDRAGIAGTPGRGGASAPALPEGEPSDAAPPSPAPDVSAGCRVLVVDDNRDSAETLALLLELLGHDTRIAHDGLRALQIAPSFRPQAVLLDIGLPRLDGYAVCRALRREPWGGELLMVALTGWGKEEDRRRSREAGFDVHLVKPVDPQVLQDLLARRAARPR